MLTLRIGCGFSLSQVARPGIERVVKNMLQPGATPMPALTPLDQIPPGPSQ